MGVFFGMIAAFLGVRALFDIPSFYSSRKKRMNWRGFFRSKKVMEFGLVTIVMLLLLLVLGPLTFVPAVFNMLFSGGTFAGGLIAFFRYAPGISQKWKKGDLQTEEDFQESTRSGANRTWIPSEVQPQEGVPVKRNNKKKTKNEQMIDKVCKLRIDIQEEIKKKEAEARRMMNDAYLKEGAKAQILERYADSIRLLQELYAEASNVLAYLENNGEFSFDLNSLYVSEGKANQLQFDLDKLKAFRRLNTDGASDNLDDLMERYDQDLKKLQHANAMRVIREWETVSPEQTEQVGRELAQSARAGEVFKLEGDLGTGKTVLARGFARGLGITKTIASPTFTIVREYREGRLPLFHLDVYRLENEDELYDIGWEEYLAQGGVCLVEWASNVPEAMPAEAQEIRIEKDMSKGTEYRRIRLEMPML